MHCQLKLRLKVDCDFKLTLIFMHDLHDCSIVIFIIYIYRHTHKHRTNPGGLPLEWYCYFHECDLQTSASYRPILCVCMCIYTYSPLKEIYNTYSENLHYCFTGMDLAKTLLSAQVYMFLQFLNVSENSFTLMGWG